MPSSRTAVGAVLRKGVLAVAVVKRNDIIEVRRHFVGHACHHDFLRRKAVRVITGIASDYGAAVIAVEPDLAEHVDHGLHGPHVERYAVGDAIVALLPDRAVPKLTHAALFGALVRMFPKLGNIVPVLPTGRVALSDRRDTVQLLATALALTAATGHQARLPPARRTTLNFIP